MRIDQPYNYCVYQRDNDNVALIPISGKLDKAGTESVTATFQPIKGNNLLPLVQTVPVDKDGNFGASVSIPGGWYILSISGGTEYATVNKVGSGEVLVSFGHSYLQGGHDQAHNPAATDERVCTLLDMETDHNFLFGPLTGHVGPFGGVPYFYGMLGDLLVQKLDVPVLLMCCAYGGSNINMSYELLAGLTRTQFPPGYKDTDPREPFAPLEKVFTDYLPSTGIRAILMEHGYNDRQTPLPEFEQKFKFVMDYVRNHWQRPNLAIVLVQEQLTAVPDSLSDPITGAALADLIATYPDTYKGPDFNTPYWLNVFQAENHDHLYGDMIDHFAQDWNTALNDAFFSSSTPYISSENVSVYPLALYSAPNPVGGLQTLDWVVLAAMAACLVAIVVYKKQKYGYAFLALTLLAVGRLSGKL